ncbi:MAG: response regulator, partial [Clostridia bacterium]|nr:response regulator [Clostridia bacterium]
MIKIGICDDEKIYSEEIGSYISDILKRSGVESRIYKYTDPKALLDEAREKPFDVLFLDIDMPLLSGFDISRTVREISPRS